VEKSLTRFAKALRKNATDAETLLWGKLKAKQLQGIKFLKQQSENKKFRMVKSTIHESALI